METQIMTTKSEITRLAARPKIYYGWYIVGVAFLAQLMSMGLQGYTLGVFMKPMIDELGWSRSGISGVQSAGTVVNGLLAPFIGGILDRRGGRILMLVGSVITGIGFIALSLMADMWHFYAIRGLIITVGILCMGGMVVNVAISNWFVRKRGRAVAIAAMGISFGGVVLAPLSERFIAEFGWRTAFIILGVMIWVVMLVPTALFMRRRPEDMGLLPDGDIPGQVSSKPMNAVQRAALNADIRWTRAEALRTPTLWIIIASFGMAGMGLSAMMMHVTPYVSDLGFSPALAAIATSVQASTALISKVIWGLLIERIQCRFVAILAFVCAGIGLVMLINSRSLEMVYLSLAVFGMGMGGQPVIQEVVWANYFGRLTLGTIRSIGMPFMIISSAGGPLLAGLTYDMTKSYEVAFIVFVCAYSFAALLMLIVRPPVHPRAVAKDPAH